MSIGIPSDEPIDAAYGQSALDYYTSFGKDTSFVDLEVYGKEFKYQKYYGAGFELIAAAISPANSSSWHYTFRHLLVAICGIVVLTFTGLICKMLSGWETALLAIVVLFTTPTFTGNMLFNSKDIPFAMGFVITYYFLIKSLINFPNFRTLDIIGLILGIAIAVSIRIGGILLGAYLFSLLGMAILFEKRIRKYFLSQNWTNRIKLITAPFLIFAAACLLGLMFYPNFWEEPIQHVFKALSVASDFPAKITMLFEGEIIKSTSLPPNYLLKSLWISLPVIVLSMLPLTLILIPEMLKNHRAAITFFLLLSCYFPIAYVIYKDAAIYNGWRHILFFYPSLVILVSLSLKHILFPFKGHILQYFALALIFVFTLKTAIWQIANYKYQYAYYNELAGGSKEAYNKYDNDYQQLAVSECVKWLIENEATIKDENREKEIIIASNNANALNVFFDTSALNIKFINTGIQKWKNFDWDYAAVSTIFLRPKIRDFVFPPKDAIYTERIDDFEVSYLVKRKDKSDIQGHKALREQQYEQAFDLLNYAHQYDPKNLDVWLNLGYAFASVRNGSEAIKYAKKYLDFYPNSWEANYILGLGYFYLGDYHNGEKFLVTATNLSPKQKIVLKYLIQLYNASNQTEKAENISNRLAQLK